MMKRFLASVMVLLMLFCAVTAGAEGLDVTALSNDELLRLYAAVRQEMTGRGLSESTGMTLPAGKYIIGKDIMPGTYMLTCTDSSGEELGSAYSAFGSAFESLGGEETAGYGDLMGSLGGLMGTLVNTQVKILGDYGTELKRYELKKDQTVQITLEEKTALEIADGSCTLVPVR